MEPDESFEKRIRDEVAEHIGLRIAKMIALGIGFVILGGLLAFGLGWLLQFLWNATLADIFDWPHISYWEAVGIFVLAKILFGFGHSGRGMKHEGRKLAPKGASFKKYWQTEGKAAYEAYLAGHGEK